MGSPTLIADEYNLPDRKTVYRHAHAAGVFERRRHHIRPAYERIPEKIEYSAMSRAPYWPPPTEPIPWPRLREIQHPRLAPYRRPRRSRKSGGQQTPPPATPPSQPPGKHSPYPLPRTPNPKNQSVHSPPRIYLILENRKTPGRYTLQFQKTQHRPANPTNPLAKGRQTRRRPEG
jgi:hypothetical protein